MPDPLAFIDSLDISIQKLGLDRIKALMAKLGNPQDRLPVIHIAGSNGKGSTAAMLSSVLKAAGLTVGTYTSPHLIHLRERISINGNPILPEELEETLTLLQAQLSEIPCEEWPTYFECLTALALLFFTQRSVEVAILEVGLGGRFDATNIVRQPRLCIITGISLEHTQTLGDTVAKIAAEKAGILKPGVPVVLGPQLPEAAREVILHHAGTLEAPVFESNQNAFEILTSSTLETGLKILDTRDGHEYHLGLLAPYQKSNLATVLQAVDVLRQQGFTISQAAVEKGLAETYWPARFQRLSPQIILDGSHNPEGFLSLKDCVSLYLPDRALHWVLSLKNNRDPEPLLTLISDWPNTVSVTWTQASDAQTYHDPVVMAERTRMRCPGIPVGTTETAEGAVNGLCVRVSQEPGAVGLITGSLYTAGEILLASKKGFAAVEAASAENSGAF